MNVIFVLHRAPYPPHSGGQLRLFETIRRMTCFHRVHLIVLTADRATASAAQEMERYGCTVESRMLTVMELSRYVAWARFWQNPDYTAWSPDVKDYLRRRLREVNADVVIYESSCMGQYLGTSQAKEILSQQDDNILAAWRTFATEPYTSPRKVRLWLRWLRLQPHERAIAQKARHIVVVSEAEAVHYRRYNPHAKVHVVPNGVDVERITFSPTLTSKPILLFLGSISYYPNYDALGYFRKAIWPLVKQRLPEAEMVVVGTGSEILRRDPLFASDGIRIVGQVESVTEWLHAARLMIVPLRIGGGTRLKILEALSAGIPVVTTSVGAEGLDVQNSQHILIADRPDTFAQEVERLIVDDHLAEKVRIAGRALVEGQYGWNGIVEGYERILQEIVTTA